MKVLLIGILLIGMVGCAEIKPMQIPPYNPPELSHIKRPEIPIPQEGKDYFIDVEKGTVTYTISGQNLLTSKVISEKAAWQAIEMLKQMIDIQGQIIVQKDQLIVAIDLKRQYAEKEKTYSTIKEYAAYLISILAIVLVLAL